jgi:hypothetical protein
VVALASAPGKHHRDHGKLAGPEGNPGSEAVFQMTEPKVGTGQSYSSLVGHELHSKRPPDRVFKILLQQQRIGSVQAINVVAVERLRAVEVRPAQGRLKICRPENDGQDLD